VRVLITRVCFVFTSSITTRGRHSPPWSRVKLDIPRLHEQLSAILPSPTVNSGKIRSPRCNDKPGASSFVDVRLRTAMSAEWISA